MLRFSIDGKRIYIHIFSLKISLRKFFLLLMKFVRFLDLILPKYEKKMAFCMSDDYLSASSKFYEYMINNHKDDYKYSVITDKKINYEGFSTSYHLYSLKGIYELLTSKYVVFAQRLQFFDVLNSPRHIYINLWHGMPIKKLALTRREENSKSAIRQLSLLGKHALFFATSDLFKQLMISCFLCDYKRVFVTGLARNDYIGDHTNDEKIKKLFDIEKYSKVVFYVPTYKMAEDNLKSQVECEFNNIFYLDDYNKNSFIKTIEDNNILFIMKPHPRDEFFYKKNPDVLPDTANFKIVYNEDFYNNGIENYELFKFVDVMVSDYSSAPIDYLILNRPVIYLNSLAEGYSAKRGMILEENYEILMPGVKVVTYKDFEQQLLDNLYKDSYKQERERLLPLIHKYMDFNSCKRIYKVIESLKK